MATELHDFLTSTDSQADGASFGRALRAAGGLAARFQVPFALLAVGVATALFLPFRNVLDKGQWGIWYLAVIAAVAAVGGRYAALTAALASFACWNFFFIPPYNTLEVADPRDLLTLLVFLVVGSMVGVLAAIARSRAQESARREREARLLNSVSGDLLTAITPRDMAMRILDGLEEALGRRESAVFLAGADEQLTPIWKGPAPRDARAIQDQSDQVFRTLKSVGLRAESGPQGAGPGGVWVPLHSAERAFGVLFVGPAPRRSEPSGRGSSEERRLIASLANLASAYLEQARLRDEACQVDALREADRLKTGFVSSVSHELKTPLASIVATVTGMLESTEQAPDDRTKTELEALVPDLERLESAIGDLLDISRLEGAAWRLTVDSYEIGEVIGSVLAALPAASRERIRLEVEEDLPQVPLDFQQITRALRILVDNALAYSPAGSPVTVGAHRADGTVLVWVADQGPGVAPDERELIFEKFYRSRQRPTEAPGTGLGLAIAREIAQTHGGRTWAETPEEGGARFVLELPLEPPEIAPPDVEGSPGPSRSSG